MPIHFQTVFRIQESHWLHCQSQRQTRSVCHHTGLLERCWGRWRNKIPTVRNKCETTKRTRADMEQYELSRRMWSDLSSQCCKGCQRTQVHYTKMVRVKSWKCVTLYFEPFLILLLFDSRLYDFYQESELVITTLSGVGGLSKTPPISWTLPTKFYWLWNVNCHRNIQLAIVSIAR